MEMPDGAGIWMPFALRVIPTMLWTSWLHKLNRLPVATQKALQQFACIGNSAEAATLSAVLETSEQETEAELWEALHQELIVRSEDSYRFAHDRVQEAAYSLIAEEARAEAHLRIGRLLNDAHSARKA